MTKCATRVLSPIDVDAVQRMTDNMRDKVRLAKPKFVGDGEDEMSLENHDRQMPPAPIYSKVAENNDVPPHSPAGSRQVLHDASPSLPQPNHNSVPQTENVIKRFSSALLSAKRSGKLRAAVDSIPSEEQQGRHHLIPPTQSPPKAITATKPGSAAMDDLAERVSPLFDLTHPRSYSSDSSRSQRAS